MKRLGELTKKTWVFVTAAALIAGSSSAMAFVLGDNITAKATSRVVSITNNEKSITQAQTVKTETEANYSVVDLSKTVYDNEKPLREKLSRNKHLTQEQIEKMCNDILSAMIPGDKDITAEQAAAYSADIIKKAFGAELNGYIAEANFRRSAIPNSDSWTVVFHPANESRNDAQGEYPNFYMVSVNSVSGVIIDAAFNSAPLIPLPKENVNLEGSAWQEKAEQSVSPLLPKDVTIRSSKIVVAGPEVGVTVVCELSDGSAYAVRMTGENKEVKSYLFFQNGYDGSLEKNTSTNTKG